VGKIRSAKFIIFFLFIFLVAGCAKEPDEIDILRSMVELDRAYVPALLFTNLQKQRESEIASRRLSRQWSGFYRRYRDLKVKYGMDITDKFWKEDLDVVDSLITTAEGYVRQGRLEEANDRLVVVRSVLRDLRHRNGISYLLDGMTEFHEAMDEIILSLRGKDRLMDKDIAALRRLFKKAQRGWAKVSRSQIDAALFGFDAEKVAAVKKRIKEEERVLAAFAATLSSQDTDRVFQAAQDLKPNFLVLYKAFGDFKPVFDQVVRERKEKEEKERKKKKEATREAKPK